MDSEEFLRRQMKLACDMAKAEERNECKAACIDFSHHFPDGSKEREVLQRMSVRLDMPEMRRS